MKLRNGFVSNSSSSSFVIMGLHLENGEMEELLQKKFGLSEDYDSDEYWDAINNALGDDFIWHIDQDDNDSVYFGIEYTNIGDDETLNQFRQRVKDTIKERLDIERVPKCIDAVINSCGDIEF